MSFPKENNRGSKRSKNDTQLMKDFWRIDDLTESESNIYLLCIINF